MLIGTYPGSLNEKRRVAIPKKFLLELGERPVLAKWYEDCLILVTANFWEELLSKLVGKDRVAGIGVRNIERFILGSAYEMDPDDQGRIVIPEILVKFARFDKDLMFVGLTNRVEIWAKDPWEKLANDLSNMTREYVERLSEK